MNFVFYTFMKCLYPLRYLRTSVKLKETAINQLIVYMTNAKRQVINKDIRQISRKHAYIILTPLI